VDAINVAVTRGALVESRHRVHAVVVRDGDVAESWGDPEVVSFVRSAAKPLQALPLAPYGLPQEELAIACASHDALPEQLVAVRALLERAGASTEDLECGAEHGSKLRHNCSGKHAGFLFLARERGWPAEGYRLADHPVQEGVRSLVAEVVGRDLEAAVDGCGVPTFALSLVEMARVFAGLVRGEPEGADAVVRAMTAHPQLIGGPKAVDTLVMRALPGSVAKRGAEGVLCVGLPDGAGVALKVDDGANRAAYAAAGLVLGIAELQERPVHNSRGETVGTISATA
jgi:L-asparaginase II